MTIGLMRHFKVDLTNLDYSYLKWTDSEAFRKAVQAYDEAPVFVRKQDIGQWDRCYTSTLSRTVKTAESTYSGPILKRESLVEVPLAPVFDGTWKMPVFIWFIAGRLDWFFTPWRDLKNLLRMK